MISPWDAVQRLIAESIVVSGASGLSPNPALVPPVEEPLSTKKMLPVVNDSLTTV